jgi:hypothetical protein
LIRNTNALRTKLFLAPHATSGERLEVQDLCYIELIAGRVILDCGLADRKPSAAKAFAISTTEVELHPLLLSYRAEEHFRTDTFSLSCHVFRELVEMRVSGSTSWFNMCITLP